MTFFKLFLFNMNKVRKRVAVNSHSLFHFIMAIKS